jgi:acyl-CoA synthetase (AMP-forming)/AMP-acid ligase II
MPSSSSGSPRWSVPTGGFDGTAICCEYAPTAEEHVPPAEVRRGLAERLPFYMLPSRWLTLEEMPKQVNGKIDRRRLEELFEEEAEDSAAERSSSGPLQA